MLNKASYERRILNEIRSLPEEALPKVIRLLSLIKDEFVAQKVNHEIVNDETNHEKTRDLLSTSRGNWAEDIIAEREDRI